MSSRVILGYLVGFLVALCAPAFGQTIPDQPPDILLDGLFSDRFSQRPTDLYPRIEFISDRNAYFDTAGESHIVAVRVYDQDGNLVPDPTLDWTTDAPSQLGIAGESGGALLESLGNWDGPIGYTVSAPDLGVSATGQAIMADIQPGVVRVPSHWVKRVLGDRTAGHEVVLASNAVTDDISTGDIVLSGDYAGVMVHAVSVSSDGQGNVVIAAEPAAINEVFSNYQQNVTGEPLLVRIEANERRTRYTIRSQRDDVVLYQRVEPGNSVHSLLQCSGNLSLGQNIDVDFIDLEWSITPYADIDLTGGNVELFEFGVNGMISVQAQASVNLGAGVNLTGQCGPNLPDINLPGVFVYGIDIRPTIFPGANVSVSASANASAGWVPLSGLERSWELQSGVRYTDVQGWESVNDYSASGSEPAATGFDVDAALALELAARAEVGAGLSFCLGTCTLFPSLIDLTFLEAAGGPYWRLEMPAPISVDDPDYLGPAMTIGVDAGASAGVAGEFFESGILAYLPISGSFSLMTPIFEEDWTYFETDVTGSIGCNPTCVEIPEGSGTIDMTLAMDTGATGTATFWLEQPGSGQLTQIASSAFSAGQASASHPTDNLPTGDYAIYGRLDLDDAAYWFADVLPLAPGAAIGTFTVGDDDGGAPPENTGAGEIALVSGELAGQQIGPESWEISVSPGQTIAGTIETETNNLMGSGAVAPYGYTWTWGQRTSALEEIDGWISTGSSQHTTNISLTAPSQPGTYYILFGFGGEFNLSQVFSCDNWNAGGDVIWNDGNDYHDLQSTHIEQAASLGFVDSWQYRFSSGYQTRDIPVAPIRVVVGDGSSEPGDTFKDCPDCPTMVVIPAGSFVQGSPPDEPESSSNERPQRTVNVPAFTIGQTEVTFDEWGACVADGGCSHNPDDEGWGLGDRPVININWHDAQEYVEWLNSKSGHEYRLPSESEWEYATRAGSVGRFNTGDCITPDQANYDGDWSAQGCPGGIDRGETLPVGNFAGNSFGLFDTHGNVFEWVQDCWNDDYVGAPGNGSTWTTGDCSRAPMRGGSWFVLGRYVRSASRFDMGKGSRFSDVGIRVVRSVSN